MTGSITGLIAAVVVFVVSHVVLSSLTVRGWLIGVIGERPFQGLYSVLAIAILVWVLLAYRSAPVVEIWFPPTGLQHLALLVMPFSCIFVVAGLSTPNPTAVGADTDALVARGPVGIFKVTRHPVMWGIALWGVAHMLANGDAAGMLLFAGMTLLALGGAAHIDARRRAGLGSAWDEYRRQSSFVPLAAAVARRTRISLSEIGWARIAGGLALYALLLFIHPWVFGAPALPLTAQS